MKTKLKKLNRISKFIDLDKFTTVIIDPLGISLSGNIDLLDTACPLFDFSSKVYGKTKVMEARRGNITITLF